MIEPAATAVVDGGADVVLRDVVAERGETKEALR